MSSALPPTPAVRAEREASQGLSAACPSTTWGAGWKEPYHTPHHHQRGQLGASFNKSSAFCSKGHFPFTRGQSCRAGGSGQFRLEQFPRELHREAGPPGI